MLFGMTPIEYINVAILGIGGSIVVTWLVTTTVLGRWRNTLHLPSGPPHRLTAFDVILSAWVLLSVRQMAFQIAVALDDGWATSQSATTKAVATESIAGEIGILIGSVLSIAIFVAIAAVRFDGGLKAWQLEGWCRPRWLGISVILTIVAISVTSLALYGADHILRTVFEIVPAQHEKILLLQRDDAPTGLVAFAILGAVVVAPLVEEAFFRGLLLPALVKWLGSPLWAAVLSAGLFGMIHYSVAATVVPLMIFGFMLAVAYLRSGTMVLPILVHMLFNARTVIWVLLGGDPS
jgi:hypothetical protein